MVTRMRTPRRKTDWFDTRLSSDIANGAQVIVRMTPVGFSPGFTLTRFLMTLSFLPNPYGAASGAQRVAFGVGICSEDAFAVPATPDPEQVTEFPPRGWVIRDELLVPSRLDGANGQAPPNVVRLNYDLRAKRTIDNGVMYIAINSTAGSGTAFTIAAFGLTRMLCLLP